MFVMLAGAHSARVSVVLVSQDSASGSKAVFRVGKACTLFLVRRATRFGGWCAKCIFINVCFQAAGCYVRWVPMEDSLGRL